MQLPLTDGGAVRSQLLQLGLDEHFPAQAASLAPGTPQEMPAAL